MMQVEYIANFGYQKVHNGDITKDELDERARILISRTDIDP